MIHLQLASQIYRILRIASNAGQGWAGLCMRWMMCSVRMHVARAGPELAARVHRDAGAAAVDGGAPVAPGVGAAREHHRHAQQPRRARPRASPRLSSPLLLSFPPLASPFRLASPRRASPFLSLCLSPAACCLSTAAHILATRATACDRSALSSSCVQSHTLLW